VRKVTDESWQLKISRAREHVRALESEIASYMAGNPLEIVSEQHPGRLELKVVVRQPVPARWSTIVGDVLHNARSALDAALLSIVIEEQTRRGRLLSPEEQRFLQFPIMRTPTKFTDACTKGRKNLTLQDLLSPQGLDALRSVQPFWFWEQVAADEGRTFTDVEAEEGSAREELPWLQELSNIDKHRHVHLLPMLPSTVAHPPLEGVTWQFNPHPPTSAGGTVGWFLHPERDLPPGFVGEVHSTLVLPPGDDGKPFHTYPLRVTDDLDNLVGAADTAARKFMTRARSALV
jgi:hypothetical protein